ncbi:hypothetical protein NM688_g5950 [Phlebia brevispora]|uniref:Uncharacterized protein n=1 Tax=Phlebia brevispora TaxID=194682 RepID=A0ACC1SME9_9APHY|nr:hypothetical protein NM688_g5950 [Phlebia brevispora]
MTCLTLLVLTYGRTRDSLPEGAKVVTIALVAFCSIMPIARPGTDQVLSGAYYGVLREHDLVGRVLTSFPVILPTTDSSKSPTSNHASLNAVRDVPRFQPLSVVHSADPDSPLNVDTPAPRASNVPKRSELTPTDCDLRSALHRFRGDKTAKLCDKDYFRNLGAGIVMGDGVLQRVVDRASVRKLKSVDDLCRETKWARATKFGEAVLQIVHN